MPSLPEATQTKIDNLRTISSNWSEPIDVYQIVAIYWDAGTQYYSNSRPDLTTDSCPVSPIESVLITDNQLFLPTTNKGTLNDEEIDLEVWDADGAFADLVEDEGEGVKVEVYYWIPAETLFLLTWWGHLRTDEGSDNFVWRGNISNGFRSPDLPLPSRAHYAECQAIFGGMLSTQAEIDEGGCPYNKHIGGGVGNFETGSTPWETCPRLSTTNCTERGVDPLFHLSHQSSNVTVVNRQTSGPDLNSTSRGNETNLKKPVRVVMGRRRLYDMEVLAYARHFNNNDPDRGFFEAIYEGCEGPIQSFQFAIINGQNAQPVHYFHFLGNLGQPSHLGLSNHGYSGTANIRYNYGWVNPAGVDPNAIRASSITSGLKNIRVYSDSETYNSVYTTKRIWHIARMLTDKRWGFGLDYGRLNIDSLIECEDFDDYVRFTDNEGTNWDYQRGESHVELNDRTAQQEIEDMCWAGRFSRPFLFQGELHIIPLRPLTEDELNAAPVFSDEGGATRNIIVEEKTVNGNSVEVSSLTRTRLNDEDLPNRIEATFDNETNQWFETPAPPVEDITQQLKAGRVLGDTTRRKVTKKYSYLGITKKSHAVALSHHILWFGQFEEGGTKNNLEITFKIWFLDALDLHEFKVIKVTSSQLTRYGFSYFRIKEIKYQNNLHVEIVAQAYNETEINNFEVSTTPPGGGGGGGGGDIPCSLTFGTISYTDGVLSIPVDPCL